MNFVAIDVETANPSLSSICQVGAAVFSEGRICNTWESLVNPEDYFDPMNVWIHGIDADQVQHSPTWRTAYESLRSIIEGSIVVSHTAFDRTSLLRACEKNHLPSCELRWLDSAKVVRRAWPEFSKSGYGLANVAAHFNIGYKAHDALEDARCAGEIVVRAISETGLSIEDWLERVDIPIHTTTRLDREVNPNGPLCGEVIVFTGSLLLARFAAADAAADAGCEVNEGITKRTTLLVVGNQDIHRLAGHLKSSKHRKAEALIASGQKIRILSESDFIRLVK